jgi:hypothetical protein
MLTQTPWLEIKVGVEMGVVLIQTPDVKHKKVGVEMGVVLIQTPDVNTNTMA